MVNMDDDNLPIWINCYGWNDYKKVKPDKNSEVIIFYAIKFDEMIVYETLIISEDLIDAIDSPLIYWINKPE